MTLEQIDAALAALPASPVTDEGISARADLMWKRGEIISTRLTEAARPCVVPGNLEVVVPAGVSCVYTGHGLTRMTETVDNRQVIYMTAGEFRALIGGQTGGAWVAENPEIVRQLAVGDMVVNQVGMR
jgi:hypothetical protein